MVGAAAPVLMNQPQVLDEEQGEERKEHAGDLVPERAGSAGKRVPNGSAEAFSAFFGAPRGLTDRGTLAHTPLARRSPLCFCRRGRSGGENSLAGETHADAQRATQSFRAHGPSVADEPGAR
jgi:hypothetical protein